MEPRRETLSRTAGTRFDGCGCTLTKSASIRIESPRADRVPTGAWPLSLVSAEPQITRWSLGNLFHTQRLAPPQHSADRAARSWAGPQRVESAHGDGD